MKRSVALALALVSPALAFGQAASPQDNSNSAAPPPVQPVQGVGSTGAVLPGATVPGETSGRLGEGPPDFAYYGVAAGIGETDNVKLSSTNPKSQTLAAANLDFDLKRTGSRLDASALGVFTDINFLQGAFSNQVLGRFDGIATAKLWSDRLKWVVADDFGEEQTDPFAAITPVNLQRVNIVSTGPDLTLRPSYATFINVGARYSRTTYQTSPFDGHDLLGSAEFGRQLSPLSRMSAVIQAEQLRFDNTLVNTNYDRRAAYARYLLLGARTSIDAQLGATQANDTESWKTSPLVRLLLTRRLSPYSDVTISGGREYSDASRSFGNLEGGPAGGITVAPVSQTTANYQRTYGSAGWRFRRLRTTVGLIGTWERDVHDLQSVFDATREGVALKVERALTPELSANLTGTVDHYRYLNEGFTDKIGTVGAGLSYRAARWVVVYGRYDHAFRRSSGAPGTPFLSTAVYDENRVFIMVGYRPHSAGTEPGEAPGYGGTPTP